jgi:hypothetical protein
MVVVLAFLWGSAFLWLALTAGAGLAGASALRFLFKQPSDYWERLNSNGHSNSVG